MAGNQKTRREPTRVRHAVHPERRTDWDPTCNLLALSRLPHHRVPPGTSCRLSVYTRVALHTSDLHSWSTGLLGPRTVLADRPRNQLASPPLVAFPPTKSTSRHWRDVQKVALSTSYALKDSFTVLDAPVTYCLVRRRLEVHARLRRR